MSYLVAVSNKKYNGITCCNKELKAFGRASATVKLFNGTRGRMIGDYFIEDVVINGEVMQVPRLVSSISQQIKTVGINGFVVAKRSALGQPLKTNGIGWREYGQYLPKKN